eukprot:jgi/Psemu1/576/gm1.576_g
MPASGKTRNRQLVNLFCRDFGAKLVLEVFGAGGAVWGFSEVCGLRTESLASRTLWRILALATTVVFGVRWVRQYVAAWKRHGGGGGGGGANAHRDPELSLRELSSTSDDGNNGNNNDEFGQTEREDSSDELTALALFPRSPRA